MNLTQSQTEIHNRALEVSSRYKRTEADLLKILQEVEDEKIFSKLGYTSLFDYSVKALKLADGTAYNFVNVSRKAKEIPELQQAIQLGDLTVSNARKITSVITNENKEKWIEMACDLPQKLLEKEVAKVNPQAVPVEKAKYIQEKRIALSYSVSEELYNQLKRVQDLESQNSKGPVTLENITEAMVQVYLTKKDPLKKALRIGKKMGKTKAVGRGQIGQRFLRTVGNGSQLGTENKNEFIPFNRYPLAADLKHKVYLRDKGQCQFETYNKKCGATRWVQIHHIIPIREGGVNELINLKTLCSAHHQATHEL